MAPQWHPREAVLTDRGCHKEAIKTFGHIYGSLGLKKKEKKKKYFLQKGICTQNYLLVCHAAPQNTTKKQQQKNKITFLTFQPFNCT